METAAADRADDGASGGERARHGSGNKERPGERWLTGGVIAIVALAPLAIGGAPPWIQLVLGGATLALFVTFLALHGERHVKLAPLASVLLVAAGLTALQLVPLPRALVGWLAPETLQDRVDAAGALPSFLPLSLDVPATILEVVKAIALAGLFVVVSSIAHRRRRAVPIMIGVAATGGLIAVLGILQRSLGADRILWIYHPDWWGGFVGTFVNNNHAAGFFGLGICVAIGLAAEPSRWRSLAIIGAAVSTVALGMTLSRGGVIAFGLAGLTLAAVILGQRYGKATGLVLAGMAVAGVALALPMLFEGVSDRFAQLNLTYLLHNQKVQGWRDALPMIADHRWAGVGRGAFSAPFQRYRSVEDGTTIAHPENLFLQLAAEWGVPATIAIALLAGATVWRHRKRFASLNPVEWGAALAVAGVLLQNQVDFGLELLGVAMPTVALLGVVVARACAKESVARVRVGQPAAIGFVVLWAGALGLGLWALPHTLRADDERLTAMLARHAPLAEVDAAAHEAILRHPSDYHVELLDAVAHVRAGDPAALHHINRVLRLRPREVEAHRLAGLTLAHAQRPLQAALEYRTAFDNGLGKSVALLDEVSRLLGSYAVDAMPQDAASLMLLASQVSAANPALADAACARALELAPTDERIPLLGLKLASAGTNDWGRVARAAATLERLSSSPEVVVAAATGFRAAGRSDDAGRVLHAGTQSFPQDATVGIAWVQHQLDGGDLHGARASLDCLERATTSLEARRRAEELRAVVEQRAGDDAAAVSARLRARLYSRALGGADRPMP